MNDLGEFHSGQNDPVMGCLWRLFMIVVLAMLLAIFGLGLLAGVVITMGL